MPASLTADDILPLIAKLSDKERGRLLRLVRRHGSDAEAYTAQPVGDDELSSDEDPLSWDSDGWENVG